MSNPAVITLDDASNPKAKIKRFVLEDNIGESLHLHIDTMRIDFTVDEFLSFSQMIRSSLLELDFLAPYSINDFDEHFLKECAPFLSDLLKIEIEEIPLSRLDCIVHKSLRKELKLVALKKIEQSPAYKYLKGNKQEFIDYTQFNYFNTGNEIRLERMQESILEKGYPLENNYIVLFNGQNIIRDGQHRASILADQLGLDAKVKVMRFYFKGNKHLIRVNKTNAKTTFMWFARKVKRKLKEILKG
jgi:2C-methyl-D-erythritol 2,4-cyclodiphosphate synthase